jgi:hypothetical protein
MNYYVLVDNKHAQGRWYLKGPTRLDGTPVDPRTFTTGRPVLMNDFGTLFVPLRRRGQPLDYTLADFDMPVARFQLAVALEERCSGEVQLIPARVEGATEDYAILNLTQRIRCLDEKTSGVTWWTAADGRPEKIGEYMIVAHPRIDAARAGGRSIFRIQGWENVVVVSEEIRDIFLSSTGAVLQPA